MNKVLVIIGCILLSGCSADLSTLQEGNLVSANYAKNMRTKCVFDSSPNIEYQSFKPLKAARGTYGSVSRVMPKLLNNADRAGANTVVNFQGGQRFGFWPWRIVRPVMYGTGVNWKGKNDLECKALGGRVYAIESNRRVYDITNSVGQ